MRSWENETDKLAFMHKINMHETGDKWLDDHGADDDEVNPEIGV